MKLLSFGQPGEERPGVLLDGSLVLDLAAVDASLAGSWRRMLRHDRLQEVAALCARRQTLPAAALRPLEGLRLAAPISQPSKIVCLGLNYLDHAREQDKQLPERPLLFAKAPSALAGAHDPIRIPPGVDHVDFEAELAFVVSRPARRVAVDDAMSHVAGYMCFNDVSARKLQRSEGQWFRAKSFDSFAPCCPWLVTVDEIEDPHRLAIHGERNGERLQQSSTDQLARRVPELLSYISHSMTLEPGDIVSTGTPGGVGVFRDPPVFLAPGDEVVVRIEGIGELRNRVEAG